METLTTLVVAAVMFWGIGQSDVIPKPFGHIVGVILMLLQFCR